MNSNFYSHSYLKGKTYKNLFIIGSIGIGILFFLGGMAIPGDIISAPLGFIAVALGVLIIYLDKRNKEKAIATIVQKTSEQPQFLTEAYLLDYGKGHLGVVSDKILFVTLGNQVLGFNLNEVFELGFTSEDSGNFFSRVRESEHFINIETENLQLTTFYIYGTKGEDQYLKQWIIDPNKQSKFSSFVSSLQNSLGYKSSKSELEQHLL